MSVNEPSRKPASTQWKVFQITGAIAALLAALVFRRWLSAEFDMARSLGTFQFPTTDPVTLLDWFTLLQTNKLVGLLMLNALDALNYALVSLMYFGVYSVLQSFDRARMTFAMALTIIGIAIYFSSNQAFTILSLSNQYIAAPDLQKQSILASGQLALTTNSPVTFGTGVFWSFLFLYLAGIIISLVMLESNVFNKWTASIGIIANAFGLGYFFTAAFAPMLSIIPAVGSAPCNLVWYILIALRLLKLARARVSSAPLNDSREPVGRFPYHSSR